MSSGLGWRSGSSGSRIGTRNEAGDSLRAPRLAPALPENRPDSSSFDLGLRRFAPGSNPSVAISPLKGGSRRSVAPLLLWQTPAAGMLASLACSLEAASGGFDIRSKPVPAQSGLLFEKSGDLSLRELADS